MARASPQMGPGPPQPSHGAYSRTAKTRVAPKHTLDPRPRVGGTKPIRPGCLNAELPVPCKTAACTPKGQRLVPTDPAPRL